jgi:transposase
MNSMAYSPHSASSSSSSALAEENALLREQLGIQAEAIRQLKQQLNWLKEQLFVPKFEKHVVQACQRGSGKKQWDDNCLNDTCLRFNDDVSAEVIATLSPELSGPGAGQYNIIGTKITYRLAQRAASQVAELAPRLWKLRFADKSLRSQVDKRHPNSQSSKPKPANHAH